MSTPASELVALEKKIGVFLSPSHIILVLALAASIFVGVYVFESKQVEVAQAKAEIAKEVAIQAKDDAIASAKQNELFQAQTAVQMQALQAANAQLTAANEQLAAAMRAEAAALASQQSADKHMTPSQQANRWQLLVPTAKVASSSTGFEVDAQGGLDTILQLEQVPVLTKQLAQANQTIENDKVTIANDASLLTKEQAAHSADVENDKKQLVAAQDETKKVQSDFNLYKKKARRNILRAYAAGVVTGIVVRKWLGF